jgi:uncharacterized protein (TIGR03382 family)
VIPLAWALTLSTLGAARAHVPVIYFAGPGDDWCAVINGTEGSDIVMLSGGEYTGPCVVHANVSDTPGEQTTVQSLDPLDPAVFVGSDADFVLRLEGESLLVLELLFRDLPDGIDAVRVGDIREVAVRRSWFHGLGGGGVVQEASVEGGLVVSDTEFLDVARPVTLGCAGACAAGRLEVAESLVVGASTGVTVAGPAGLVIDNVLVGVTEGIRIDGVPGGAVEVVGNLVEATGAAIAVVGGVSVRSNVGMGALALGAGAGAEVGGNTWVGELSVDDARLVNNAVVGAMLDSGDGNVVCDERCFVDAAGWDFFPAPASPLRGAGIVDDAVGADWCGRVRGEPPSVGAIEAFGDASFGPLAPTFKEAIDCALPLGTTDPTDPEAGSEPTVDTGSATTPSAPPGVGREGCGCGGGSASSWPWIALLAVVRRRGRP